MATAVGLTDTLFALGVQDRLVGVGSTDYANPLARYAEAYARVPSLGKTSTGAKEVVLSKQPDLVFAAERSYSFDAKSGLATIAELENAGAAVYVSAGGCDGERGPLSTVYTDVENIAKLLRVPERGRALVAELRERVAEAKALLQGRRMKVAIVNTEATGDLFASNPDYTIGGMVAALGQANAFADFRDTYTPINPEEVVRRNPDAILMGPGRAEIDYARTKFKNTNAVRDGRVFNVDGAGGNPGSIRQIDQLVQIARDLSGRP